MKWGAVYCGRGKICFSKNNVELMKINTGTAGTGQLAKQSRAYLFAPAPPELVNYSLCRRISRFNRLKLHLECIARRWPPLSEMIYVAEQLWLEIAPRNLSANFHQLFHEFQDFVCCVSSVFHVRTFSVVLFYAIHVLFNQNFWCISFWI